METMDIIPGFISLDALCMYPTRYARQCLSNNPFKGFLSHIKKKFRSQKPVRYALRWLDKLLISSGKVYPFEEKLHLENNDLYIFFSFLKWLFDTFIYYGFINKWHLVNYFSFASLFPYIARYLFIR